MIPLAAASVELLKELSVIQIVGIVIKSVHY